MKPNRRKAGRRLILTLATTALAAVALSACGTTQATTGEVTNASKSISIKDASGASVRLDGPATRVIATEWNVVENLVSLGVEPVGVADVKGYSAWSSSVPLVNDPKDIGTRGEPSVETVASLDPDLIVATTDLPAAAVAQLKKVAPVLVVRSAKASGQIKQMLTNFDQIAKATGTEKRAASVTAAFEKSLSTGKATLEAAGLADAKIAFADGYVQANQVGIRSYTSGSLIGQVIERLGLTDAWTATGDKDYGLAATDVEGLTSLGDVHFMYLINSQDGGDPFAEVLGSNAVWQSLAFVKDGNLDRLPDGIWMFGGPESMEHYADAVVAALTK